MMIASRRALVLQLGAASLAACADPAPAAGLSVTPREIEGPFFPLTLPPDTDADLTRLAGRTQRALGSVIEVTGRVLDRQGRPIPDARVELWQCNAAGRYAHPADTGAPPLDPGFQGYGLLRTGADGQFRVTSVKPAAYWLPEAGQRRTPHLHFKIAAGSRRLTTQMYFPGEPLNETDMLIRRMSADPRTLIARAAPAAEAGAQGYAWDIVLAG